MQDSGDDPVNRSPIVLMLMLLIGLSTGLVSAGESSEVSLDRAIAEIKSETNARILHAETIRLNGRLTHQIRLLTKKGLVRRIQVDARSGRKLPLLKRRR